MKHTRQGIELKISVTAKIYTDKSKPTWCKTYVGKAYAKEDERKCPVWTWDFHLLMALKSSSAKKQTDDCMDWILDFLDQDSCCL